MAALLVELDPALLSSVVRALAQFDIREVKPYPNVSAFLNTHIWLFDAPVGSPIGPLATVPGIKYAEPDEEHIYVNCGLHPHSVGALGTRHLSLGAEVSALQSSLPEIMAQIGVPQALAKSNGGEGVVILVVDSGVDDDRVPPERRAGGWTDDPSGDPWEDDTGHGSMVATIALAVAPNAKVFSVRLRPGPNGGLMKESVMSAVDALIPLVQANPDMQLVMNNSWGTGGCNGEPYW